MSVDAAAHDSATVPADSRAKDEAAFFASPFKRALFFATFLEACGTPLLTATFFAVGTAFFAAEDTALSAFANRQRCLVAAMILSSPSALIRRFAVGACSAD